ncbi:hypothetical protein ACH4E7_21295 [Kitasatospora sp. NPDC018058]|uniref:hypothetical protein n=1 Tax=Kitasatospora sp. NPDC018058 TaxID=3364025 RepID=UPI0037C16021
MDATDPDGATTRFTVHAQGAAERIDDLEALLRGLGTPGRALAVKIEIAEHAAQDGSPRRPATSSAASSGRSRTSGTSGAST